MAEPQPPEVQEGMEPPTSLPASKEDRKAAQALSSLDAKGEEEDAAGKPKKEVDLKALGEAMKNLELTQGGGGKATGVGGAAVDKKEEAPKKLIPVDAQDVNLLVDQLDLTKAKATDLLRAHDANAVQAMSAWVSASG